MDLSPVAGGRGSRPELADIDSEIVKAVDEAYGYCTENPGSRLATENLGSKDDAENWLSDARAAAYHATPRLVVNGNVAKVKGSNPATYEARFSVELYVKAAATA